MFAHMHVFLLFSVSSTVLHRATKGSAAGSFARTVAQSRESAAEARGGPSHSSCWGGHLGGHLWGLLCSWIGIDRPWIEEYLWRICSIILAKRWRMWWVETAAPYCIRWRWVRWLERTDTGCWLCLAWMTTDIFSYCIRTSVSETNRKQSSCLPSTAGLNASSACFFECRQAQERWDGTGRGQIRHLPAQKAVFFVGGFVATLVCHCSFKFVAIKASNTFICRAWYRHSSGHMIWSRNPRRATSLAWQTEVVLEGRLRKRVCGWFKQMANVSGERYGSGWRASKSRLYMCLIYNHVYTQYIPNIISR